MIDSNRGHLSPAGAAPRSGWLWRGALAVLLFLLSAGVLVAHGVMYDHSVFGPTRHCRPEGAVPTAAFAAGFAGLLLAVAAVVLLSRTLRTAPRYGPPAVRICRVVLGVLLIAAWLVMLASALALYADFSPLPRSPYNCGE